jgi:hypothetical protein
MNLHAGKIYNPHKTLVYKFIITIINTFLSLQCIELMHSYAALLFSKIGEIKPEEFCKQHGMCRDIALLSNLRSDSTCVFCHHLLDEIMSKLKDPDAEVIALCQLVNYIPSYPEFATLLLTFSI